MRRSPTVHAQLFRSVASVLACAIAACSDVPVRIQAAPGVSLVELETYAWVPRSSAATQGLSEEEEQIRRDLRLLIDQGLEGLGYRKVRTADAGFLVESALSVDVRQNMRDPYYTTVGVEQYEEGKVSILALDKDSRDVVWNGSATERLRTIAQGVGVHRIQWVPTDQDREWKLAEMVTAILARFPAR